ncbi:hemolysin family protein [Kordia algicida OT-1]|uniref:Putative transmembrane CBS domain transporter n=1 Tax=Kordia algicida OT-1 TaxID=391587 RepID=A9DK60_9FLAO|nr:hemolysin family protein [Kordia algicida]EDP98262.1 putative transmembrane CBS domain transporter [Kordia algicida OT-1]
MEVQLLIIITALLFSAFFSGMEIAYVSANKIHIELEKKQDGILAKILTRLTQKPSKFIATMLVGNNVALVIYGFFMGDLLVDLIQETWLKQYIVAEYALLFQTIISTLVILFTAEFLPKVFFQVYANSLLKFLAFPAYIFYQLFWLISEFVMWISNVVLKKFFKTEGDQVQLEFSKVELGDYISEQMEAGHQDEDIDSEIQIFQNALEFSAVKTREVMIPRTEIVAIELRESTQNLAKLFSETGYSKVLVYKNTIDDIIGYVHSFELFKKPKTIRSIVLPVVFVPEAMLANDVLNVLTKKSKSIAVVLDEYGGTSGIVTVEDIVEELFGEIEDEHDVTELLEKRISEYEYLFSARLEVDYINETYKLNLPESENYETLGGLIVSETEEIPQKDEVIIINNLKFTIIEVSNTKIDTIQLQILSED